jgi:transcriptional regulator with XRE-family HTH domain
MEPADALLAKRLGARVRSRRSELQLPQSDLAEKIDTSVEYVSMLERGTRLPSLPTLIALAAALETSIDNLLGSAESGNAGSPPPDALDVAAHAVPSRLRDDVARMLRALHERPARPARPRRDA